MTGVNINQFCILDILEGMSLSLLGMGQVVLYLILLVQYLVSFIPGNVKAVLAMPMLLLSVILRSHS